MLSKTAFSLIFSPVIDGYQRGFPNLTQVYTLDVEGSTTPQVLHIQLVFTPTYQQYLKRLTGIDVFLAKGNLGIYAAEAVTNNPAYLLERIDLNDNGGIDGTDRIGPIPIIVEVAESKGKAVFISDASMFTNDLWRVTSVDEDFTGRTYQNNEFIIDLVYSMASPDGEVIFDSSKQTAGFSNYHGYPD